MKALCSIDYNGPAKPCAQTASVQSAECDFAALYKAEWLTTGDQHPWHARPVHPPSCMGASKKLQNTPILYELLRVSFKHDTRETSVSVQEISPITQLLKSSTSCAFSDRLAVPYFEINVLRSGLFNGQKSGSSYKSLYIIALLD